MTAKILHLKHCCGCGVLADECAVLVALPGPQYVCEGCIKVMAAIISHEAPEETRIIFVDAMVEILKEPIEIVTKWKEIRAARSAKTEGEATK